MNVLFVCTGNTCRSPMAAALFASVCRRENLPVTVLSAGLAADGSPASAHAVTVMAEMGLDIASHRSHTVTREVCAQADLIVAMSARHAMALTAAFGVPSIKIRVPSGGVPDPFGGDKALYRATRDALLAYAESLYGTLTDPITVAPFTADEVAAVAQLETLCFADPWSDAALAEELTNPCAVFRVAKASDGSVIGYGGMHHAADEGAIANVAVHPAWRGRGVGRTLVRALKEYGDIHGLARITLEVRASNEPAIRLYESEGFAFLGIRPRFYDYPKEDARMYGYTPHGQEE